MRARMKGHGLSQKLTPSFLTGFSNSETVKLDFDHIAFKIVKNWAFEFLKLFKLRGFIILKSSDKNYHVLYDRRVSWIENVRIMAWICLRTKHHLLTRWFIMQCIKKSSTLRVSPKGNKSSPRIVLRYGNQDSQVREFKNSKKSIKRMLRKMSNVRAQSEI